MKEKLEKLSELGKRLGDKKIFLKNCAFHCCLTFYTLPLHYIKRRQCINIKPHWCILQKILIRNIKKVCMYIVLTFPYRIAFS